MQLREKHLLHIYADLISFLAYFTVSAGMLNSTDSHHIALGKTESDPKLKTRIFLRHILSFFIISKISLLLILYAIRFVI